MKCSGRSRVEGPGATRTWKDGGQRLYIESRPTKKISHWRQHFLRPWIHAGDDMSETLEASITETDAISERCDLELPDPEPTVVGGIVEAPVGGTCHRNKLGAHSSFELRNRSDRFPPGWLTTTTAKTSPAARCPANKSSPSPASKAMRIQAITKCHGRSTRPNRASVTLAPGPPNTMATR